MFIILRVADGKLVYATHMQLNFLILTATIQTRNDFHVLNVLILQRVVCRAQNMSLLRDEANSVLKHWCMVT